jgi:hypothetical protein
MNADILDNKFLNSVINTSMRTHTSACAHKHKEGFTIMSFQEELQCLDS